MRARTTLPVKHAATLALLASAGLAPAYSLAQARPAQPAAAQPAAQPAAAQPAAQPAAAQPAAAQPGIDPQAAATRQLLLEQATQARVANDWPRALELARRAGQLQMTPSVRVFIAEAEQATNQLPAALVTASTCIREAEADVNLRSRDVILARCRELRAALLARVGHVVLRVPSPSPAGLRITVAGATVPEALYGLPYVVQPGEVSISATAQGREPFTRTLTVTPGQEVPLEIALATTAAVVAPGPLPPPPPRPSLVGPIVVMAAGAAILGAGGAFVAVRDSTLGSSGCTRTADQLQCPTAEAGMRAQGAYTFNTLANVAWGVGGAAMAGGLVWLIVNVTARPQGQERRASLRVAPVVDPTRVGLAVGGSF